MVFSRVRLATLLPLALSLALLALAPGRAAAEPLHLPAESARALQAVEDGAGRLQRAHATLDALLDRRTPPGGRADWDGTPGALVAAADALRRAEGPALPDAGAYAFPAEPLRACATRAAARARLERSQRGAAADAARCVETRTLLRERLAQVQAAEQARRGLLERGPPVAGDPDVEARFGWRWTDLDRPLATALATISAELRRWLERVERAHGEVRGRASALATLAADTSRLRDCVLAGTWNGLRTREGTMAGLSLKLMPAGGTWTGTINVDGEELPVRGVKLNGNAVSLTAGDGQGSLRGTLSADEQVLKGTYSSLDGPATFTLRRQ